MEVVSGPSSGPWHHFVVDGSPTAGQGFGARDSLTSALGYSVRIFFPIVLRKYGLRDCTGE